MRQLTPMTISEQLAYRVRTKRRLLGLTQTQLARLAGTSQAAIARLEHAQGNPTASLMQRVATALDLEITLYIRPQLATLERR